MLNKSKSLSGKRLMVDGPGLNKQGNRKALLFLLMGCLFISLMVWLGSSDAKTVINNLEILPKQVEKVSKSGVPTLDSKVREVVVNSLKNKIATASGEWAVWVQPIKGEGYGFNQDVEMEGASIMKVPAMLYVWREITGGRMSASDSVRLKEVDRSPGSGPLVYLPENSQVSWQRILSEMGKKSDNTGWRIVNRVFGSERIAEFGQEIGMESTNYKELVYTTTARDVGKLFLFVNKQNDEFKSFLRSSIYEDRIAVGVPGGVDVVHKVGTLADVWIDAGILSCKTQDICKAKPFVLVILNKGVDVKEAAEIFPELVKIVWKYENR